MRIVLAVFVSFMFMVTAVAAPGDSRDEPVPLGKTATVDDFDVRVIEYRVATEFINEWLEDDAEEPRPGYVYALTQIVITYHGEGTGQAYHFSDASFIDSGSVELLDTQCGAADFWRMNAEDSRADLFDGGSISVYHCAQVTRDQYSNLYMYFEDGGQPVFFALGNEVRPTPAATPPATPVS